MAKYAVEVVGNFEEDYQYHIFEHEDRTIAEAMANGYIQSIPNDPQHPVFISIEELKC